MKKKKPTNSNYLERKPLRNCRLSWTADDEGAVTVEIKNRGLFNLVAQKFLKKPKTSYVHLDETGSFIWRSIDGKKDISELGKSLEGRFGEKAYPLYERLVKYVQLLESCGFVTWADE